MSCEASDTIIYAFARDCNEIMMSSRSSENGPVVYNAGIRIDPDWCGGK